MKNGQHFGTALAVLLALGLGARGYAEEPKSYFPTFADDHTVALWLFDDPEYVHTTITDASVYEYDLQLMGGGRLVPGKFGRALRVTAGPEPAVSFAGFQGAIA